jgi:hypothetical protein
LSARLATTSSAPRLAATLRIALRTVRFDQRLEEVVGCPHDLCVELTQLGAFAAKAQIAFGSTLRLWALRGTQVVAAPASLL